MTLQYTHTRVYVYARVAVRTRMRMYVCVCVCGYVDLKNDRWAGCNLQLRHRAAHLLHTLHSDNVHMAYIHTHRHRHTAYMQYINVL